MNKFIDTLVHGLNESISDMSDELRDTIETICLRTNNDAEWILVQNNEIIDQKIRDEYATRRDFVAANKDKKLFTIHNFDSKVILAMPEDALDDEKTQELLGELNPQE